MRKITKIGLASALALAAVAAGVQAQQAAAPAPHAHAPTASAVPSFFSTPGYLARGAGPDSLLLNPAPPAPGSGAEARDQEAAAAAVALQGTARWDLAKQDADIFGPNAAAGYSCAAGIAIGPQTTPKLNMLLIRVARDLAGSTSATKRKYMRARPFTVNDKPMCTPDHEAILRSDGSYPSGHSALGYGWGLILAQAIPDRAAQLVARGRSFGDSRRICNVHWLSDIEEGRVVASAVVARLNADPAFQADLAAARAEAAAAAGKPAAESCTAEAALLAL